MAYIGDKDWYAEVSKGLIPGHSLVHKFGRNPAVGTSYEPINLVGAIQMPQSSGASTLRIKAGGGALDTAAGLGAREVTLQGIDQNGDFVEESIATAGASASANTTARFMRLFRLWVSASGTYATDVGGSHQLDITIEDSSGTNDWAIIDGSTVLKRGQSELGIYTIPEGFTGFLLSAEGFTDSTKTTDVILLKREGIMDSAAPYQASRVVFEEKAEGGRFEYVSKSPNRIGTGCDVWILAKVDAGTAEVTAAFELLIVDNNYL